MNPDAIQAEIEKRFTLNWLIQGASQHVGMTLHHLINDELTEIHPRLPHWYDQLALINQLQWWRPLPTLLFGWPPRYWRRAKRSRRHPFFNHPLLAKFGGALAQASRRRALERARLKGIWRWPTTFSIQTAALIMRTQHVERKSPGAVMRAACHAASEAWGIDERRFQPQLIFSTTAIPPFAPVRFTPTLAALAFRTGTCAWGGVSRDSLDNTISVRAVAINGYYLTKELVKGAAELICLHGLGDLDEETYAKVIEATDRVDVEPAMLQSGGELWRRLLRASPADTRPADVLMHLARSGNDAIVDLLTSVINEDPSAGEQLRSLCGAA